MKTATKATHTPGPWNHRDGSRFITATYNGIDTPLAEICVLPRKEKFPGHDGMETLTELTEAEEQANANVLEAAPEMLRELEASTQALRKALKAYVTKSDGDCYILAAQLAKNELLIAKARGGAA